MRNVTAGLGLCLMLLHATGCGSQPVDTASHAQAELELEPLRQTNQELQRLRAENQELARLRRDNEELKRLREQTDTLPQLRHENEQLRAQLQTLKPSRPARR